MNDDLLIRLQIAQDVLTSAKITDGETLVDVNEILTQIVKLKKLLTR